MALLSVIRRWYFREDKLIREIARRPGLSRNTVRKYLRGNIVEPAYSNRIHQTKLDSYDKKKKKKWWAVGGSNARPPD